MNWTLIPQQIVTGILNGGVLALIALGIVLIYKSSEVFNFAHGQLVMVGAWLTWWFSGGTNDGSELVSFPLWLAIILGLGAAILIGLLIERLALRPMSGQPLLAIILMTLGLGQVLQGLANIAFGVEPENFSPPLFSPSDVIEIPVPPVNGQSIVFLDRIIVKEALLASFVVAVIAALLFVVFFRYTKIGLSMRATSEDHELARSVGIKVPRVFGVSWATAGILATLGGILLATTSGISATLSLVALVAFPAILLGGLESLAGAIVGGLMIGLVQALVQASTNIEVRNSAEIAPYILLLIVLIFRPEGLFGQKRIERI